MRAVLLYERRIDYDDGSIVELRIWHVSAPVPPSSHRYKYSLFFGLPGEALVLYDNERGKGDHRHLLDVELAYRLTTVERLLADFWSDVRAMRGKR
ncbi:MAG: hypothetical protein FJX46_13085 [Alphaproteobacteria bacterium]|nr:hypothetical protein [Alphaproteobacteria bacterium]